MITKRERRAVGGEVGGVKKDGQGERKRRRRMCDGLNACGRKPTTVKKEDLWGQRCEGNETESEQVRFAGLNVRSSPRSCLGEFAQVACKGGKKRLEGTRPGCFDGRARKKKGRQKGTVKGVAWSPAGTRGRENTWKGRLRAPLRRNERRNNGKLRTSTF